MILMLHLLPALSLSLRCTKGELRCGFKLTWRRNRPESKDYKGVKASASCGSLWKALYHSCYLQTKGMVNFQTCQFKPLIKFIK